MARPFAEVLFLLISLKSFREDGRSDVICSGSSMGINYREIESNSVGNKEDITKYRRFSGKIIRNFRYRRQQRAPEAVNISERSTDSPMPELSIYVTAWNSRSFR